MGTLQYDKNDVENFIKEHYRQCVGRVFMNEDQTQFLISALEYHEITTILVCVELEGSEMSMNVMNEDEFYTLSKNSEWRSQI